MRSRWVWVVLALIAVVTVASVIGIVVLVGDTGTRPGAAPAIAETHAEGEPEPAAESTSAEDITYYATASASTALHPEGGNTYLAGNLLDGAMSTCWAEGMAGYGLGESVRFRFDEPVVLSRIRIMPGYRKVAGGWDRWWANGRLQRVEVAMAGGKSEVCRIADTKAWHVLHLDNVRTTWVEVTVLAVYPALPGPNAATDTCVSEVQFWGWFAGD